MSEENSLLLAKIENKILPALELSSSLEITLVAIHQNLQDVVYATDLELLDEADTNSEIFIGIITSAKNNNAFVQKELFS